MQHDVNGFSSLNDSRSGWRLGLALVTVAASVAASVAVAWGWPAGIAVLAALVLCALVWAFMRRRSDR